MASTRRQVSIFINGKEVENTIKGITAEKRKLTAELNRMTVGSDEYIKTTKQIAGLNTILNKHRQDLKGVETGWSSVTSGAKKFLNASNLAAVAGLAGITVGAQAAVEAVADSVKEVNTLRREITQLTGAGGDELDEITVKVRALGRTFELDTNETIRAGNSLVKEFGIEYGKAFDIIAEGNILGANASGEFLENIREYSVQYAAAGFSAEEFLKLSIRAQQEGVFSDKGLDVVKDFGERIREQSTATTEALDAAFGKQFTDKLFKSINDGSITTANALKTITAEIAKTEIPANRLQTVIADVFGGPGEEAGLRFIKTLQYTQDELGGTSTEANLYETELRNLLNANTDLATAENKLATQLQSTGGAFTLLWTNIKTVGFNTLSDLIGIFEYLPIKIKASVAAVRQAVSNLFSSEDARTSTQAYYDTLLSELDKNEKKKQAAREVAAKQEEQQQKQIEEELAKKRAARASEQTRKQSEQELKALEKKLEKINETIAKYQNERELADLTDNEKRLEKIRQQYEKEIAETEALELSKNERISQAATEQKIELLRLQSEALEAERVKISEEETTALLDRLTAETEARLELEETLRQERADVLAEIKEFTDEALRTDAELELERLNEQGARLLELAQSQGIDTVEIKRAIEAEKAEIDKKAKEKELEREKAAFEAKQEIQQAQIGLAKDLSKGLSEVAGENEALQKGLFVFNKAIAAAEVIVNLQRQLAVINATYAAAPPVAIALSTIAKVRAGISLATIAATAIAGQRKHGGWATVRGADDGQTYHARLIGQPSTGMLDYPHPVLTGSGILANEIGKEYYVSHTDLRKPAVLNHVRAIENITQHRQRQNGGFAPTDPAANTSTTAPVQPVGDPMLREFLAANLKVLMKLDREGVKLLLENNDLIALNKQLNTLVSASGGRALN